MGLLGNLFDFEDPQNAMRSGLALGLLTGRGRNSGEIFSNALGQGLQMRNAASDMAMRKQQFERQKILDDSMMAERNERAKKAKQEAENDQALREYAKRFYQPESAGTDFLQQTLPEQYRVPPIPSKPARFDTQGFMAGLPSIPGIDPFKALELQKKFAPKEEEFSTNPVYDQHGNAVTFSNLGNFRRHEGIKARDKMEFVEGVGMNPYTGTVTAVVPNPNKPFSLQNVDGGLRAVANAPFQNYERSKAAAGASRTTNTVINKGQDAFDVELGKLDAKELETLREGAKAGQGILGTVKNLREAEARGAYSGGGADARLAAANLIEGWTGIAPKGLAGSQIFNAEANKLILDRVKALGANPSNADREFLLKTVPQLSTNAKARAEMADWMEAQATRSIKKYQDADQYARQNRGLTGFNMFPPEGDRSPFGAPKMPEGFRVIR
jgi:hypothetical protein